MKTKMIGNVFCENPRRMAGTYQIAYEATTESGKTGTVLFVYEYDGRDVVTEEIYTTPEIAEETKTLLGDDSPCCLDCFPFPDPDKGEENQNGNVIGDIIKKATVLVYGDDSD